MCWGKTKPSGAKRCQVEPSGANSSPIIEKFYCELFKVVFHKVKVTLWNQFRGLQIFRLFSCQISCTGPKTQAGYSLFAQILGFFLVQLPSIPTHLPTTYLEGTAHITAKKRLVLLLQRPTLKTCGFWDSWSEWWGNMNWPTIWQFFDNFNHFWQFWHFWLFTTVNNSDSKKATTAKNYLFLIIYYQLFCESKG